MIKNAKIGKSDLSLNIYVQYVEYFKFWVMAADLAHRIPEKEIVECFANGLKSEILSLATYWDIFEISEHIKKPEVKKDFKGRPHYVASATTNNISPKAFSGSSPVSSSSYSNKSGKDFKEIDLKDVDCFQCHKKGHYANKCPEIKSKESKGVFKVQKMEEESEVKSEDKVVRQIRMRFFNFADRNPDPF